MKSATVGVAIVAISLGVSLAGCGSDSKSDTKSPSETTSTSTSAKTSAAPTTSAQASGPNETIADYVKQNNIQETPVTHSTPGAPTIDLPVPEGWSQLPESPDAPYGGIVFGTPAAPNDPPKILAMVSKLTGAVDTDKLLSYAPGELKNLPGFDGGDGEKDSLSGFPAYQIGGMYTRDGVQPADRPEDRGDPGQGRHLRVAAQRRRAGSRLQRVAGRDKRDRREDHDHTLSCSSAYSAIAISACFAESRCRASTLINGTLAGSESALRTSSAG